MGTHNLVPTLRVGMQTGRSASETREMGRDRYQIYDDQYPHFITLTVVKWLPILGRRQVRDVLIDSLKFLQNKRAAIIYGYVIMENHLHVIVRANELGDAIARFKSFTARQIIDLLVDTKQKDTLLQLKWFKSGHKGDRDFQFWQEGMHPVQIDSEEKMRQKVEYIHSNPVRRGYVADPVDWVHSSASNYAGEVGLLDVETCW